MRWQVGTDGGWALQISHFTLRPNSKRSCSRVQSGPRTPKFVLRCGRVSRSGALVFLLCLRGVWLCVCSATAMPSVCLWAASAAGTQSSPASCKRSMATDSCTNSASFGRCLPENLHCRWKKSPCHTCAICGRVNYVCAWVGLPLFFTFF